MWSREELEIGRCSIDELSGGGGVEVVPCFGYCKDIRVFGVDDFIYVGRPVGMKQ